ncbi:MAG: amidohydrolase family protein [Alphaproteobacteria bacterium]|nr:amidohydrolase family protein [Alphaproteobacteria bacterium]
MTEPYDILIRGARVFDGDGGAPETTDIAVRDGRIAARGKLAGAQATETIDAHGLWLMPGLLDIHTHYDLEVELAPGLPEAVRHGTTTVVVSNCSLGLAFGALRRDGEDPIVDCFARVENIPKPVLARVADRVTWNRSDEYLDHLNELKLGPNIVPMIPYSMLRIAAMGTNASVSRNPTDAEMAEMERLLEKGMAEGYVGFSSDALPFHYLSNNPNREKRIPSQYGGFDELKRLTDIVRRFGRVWQATPPVESPLKVLRTFLLTSARLYGKALKITAVAAMDVRSDRNIVRSAFTLARILNSKIVGGDFRLQSLAAPFKVWSDGPVTPLSEEIPELRQLMMLDLEDDAGRAALYTDPAFEEAFKKMWRAGKEGFGLARIRRILRMEELALRRAIDEMYVDNAPVAAWRGERFDRIFERLRAFQSTGDGAKSEDERTAFESFPPCRDDADFMFHMLKAYDRDLYWHTVSANADDGVVRKMTMSPLFLPGFSDSGAHLTNLAFYDVNLRALKIAMEERGEEGVAWMVRRLTRDPADFFDIAAGSIEIGRQADLTLVDPDALAAHDGVKNTKRVYRETLGSDQLVNRSDGVVPLTMIAGRIVWRDGEFTDVFESEKCGQVLLANRQTANNATATAIAAE